LVSECNKLIIIFFLISNQGLHSCMAKLGVLSLKFMNEKVMARLTLGAVAHSIPDIVFW
jgi:hypothetical protein